MPNTIPLDPIRFQFALPNSLMRNLEQNTLLQSWKTNISLDMFIEAPMHLLFLGIVKSIMEVSDTYMKQYGLGNKFISHANL